MVKVKVMYLFKLQIFIEWLHKIFRSWFSVAKVGINAACNYWFKLGSVYPLRLGAITVWNAKFAWHFPHMASAWSQLRCPMHLITCSIFLFFWSIIVAYLKTDYDYYYYSIICCIYELYLSKWTLTWWYLWTHWWQEDQSDKWME